MKKHIHKPRPTYCFSTLTYQCGCGMYFTVLEFKKYWYKEIKMYVYAVSKKVAESMIPMKDAIIISIRSSDMEKANLQNGWKDCLFLEFDDIDEEKSDMILFDKTNANWILDLIQNNQPKTVIVNCEGGISRSVGVMVALEEIFNDVKIYKCYPLHNKKVYKVLLETAYERGLI